MSADHDGNGLIADLPIFPLGSVLFPEGVLPLRIFEARYMDMVKACLRTESAFGVCLITRGGEVGEPAEHETIGCLAQIREWDMEQLGVLRIRCVGGQRFEVLERHLQKDGLVRARVRLIDPDPAAPVPAEFAVLPQLVRRIVDDLVARETDTMRQMVAEPLRYEDAGWVANRLCEFLPIPPGTRHRLMALPDPLMRLSLVHQFLAQRQVI
jgi:Lon protease-like protein